MTSEMQDHDSMRMFSDSLRKASSCCRQMARLTKNRNWALMADGLDHLRHNGEAMYKAPAPSQQQRVEMVDNLVMRMGSNQPTVPGTDTVQ